MKQISILLLVAIFSIYGQNASAQTDNSELKLTIIKSLVKTDVYLTEASNSVYDNMCRIEFHKKAINSYKEFETAYAKLKPNLSADINENLSGIINVYSQLAKSENFKYLSDASTITALLICSAKNDKVIKALTK